MKCYRIIHALQMNLFSAHYRLSVRVLDSLLPNSSRKKTLRNWLY